MLHSAASKFVWRRAACLAGVCALVFSGLACGDASAPASNLVGSWGGVDSRNSNNPATLRVTAANGTLTYACHDYVQFDQPLQPDANGRFSVTGTYHSNISTPIPNVHVEGVVSGGSMTLTVQPGSGGFTSGTYLLNYGRNAPPFQGGCPG